MGTLRSSVFPAQFAREGSYGRGGRSGRCYHHSKHVAPPWPGLRRSRMALSDEVHYTNPRVFRTGFDSDDSPTHVENS